MQRKDGPKQHLHLLGAGKKNDRLEMASEKTDPKRLTRPLDTNEYITINYSTNTLKIPKGKNERH